MIEFKNPSTMIGGFTNSSQHRRIWGAAYHEVAGMMRTGTLVDRVQALNGDKITGLTAKNLLLPIPTNEIHLNIGAALGQTDGC